ncbi:MAG: PAS domain S-box protein [Candidatus Cloacimonetes bacterium]|nr:PAS domain S-box protein [Candidatus Cloacimonadota bacterium]MDY0172460.1 PAS domain S-box protein [Candidatus Cloacimonadaceae bacterium]
MKHFNQNFYRTLFDQSPVSLWVEDFSKIYAYMIKLKEDGVIDIQAYFQTYPDKFDECISLLKVLDVNQATLEIFGAKSKEELVASTHRIFTDEAKPALLQSLVATASGRKHFEGQGINYDLQGNPLHFHISWNIPGDDLEAYERVIVAMQDTTNLERVRKELEEREALFRGIFEQASEGMMLLDIKGKVLLVNGAMERLSGQKAQDTVGRNLWDVFKTFFDKMDIKQEGYLDTKKWQEFFENPPDTADSMEYSFFDNRHKLRAYKQTMVPIKNKNQDLYAVLLTDLTAMRRSQVITSILHKVSHAVNIECSLDELFNTIHQALGQLIDVTNFFIALYDSHSNLITFPYLVDEMSENNCSIEANDNTSLTAQIISEGRTLLLDHRAIQKRTTDRGFMGVMCKNFLGIPLMLSGKVIGAMVLQSYKSGNLYDEEDKLLLESITEQIAYALHKKQADDNIHVLVQAMEQAGEGIVIFSPEGNIQYVNTIFERMTSYRRIDLLDKPFEYLPFDVGSRKEMQRSWMRVRSSQPWRGKLDLIRKDGPKITLDMVVKPVLDNNGKLSSIIASCKDVTYEIMREEQQKRTQRLEAIGRLTGGIAHDFNNILSAIIGYTELAGDDLDPDSDPALNLVEVLKSAGRAKDMISQLLSFSRQEESKTEVIELVDHVKESIRFLRSYLPRSIKIAENYSAERGTVIAVPGQIHQIIINLGTNAMHALQKDGARLEISVQNVSFSSRDMQAFPELEQCQYLKISVVDNGTGMDPAIMDHIFDPYYTTKNANEGTGLGLSIVHSIVQAHKGAIRVESTVGKGTGFQIYLPAYTPDVWHQTASASDEQEDIDGNETIMFVDDEPALVNVFRQGLMRLGYKVEGFTDPRKALDHFLKNADKIDIVVTDTTMPYMNGVELAQKMLAIRANLPVVICTGFTTLISVDDARERGIRDFVMKPFKIRDIATHIRKILDEEECNETGSITQ